MKVRSPLHWITPESFRQRDELQYTKEARTSEKRNFWGAVFLWSYVFCPLADTWDVFFVVVVVVFRLASGSRVVCDHGQWENPRYVVLFLSFNPVRYAQKKHCGFTTIYWQKKITIPQEMNETKWRCRQNPSSFFPCLNSISASFISSPQCFLCQGSRFQSHHFIARPAAKGSSVSGPGGCVSVLILRRRNVFFLRPFKDLRGIEKEGIKV